MSPEQCYGKTLDRRSDLFSLGATMFECLTGYPPFVGTTLAAVIQKICREQAPTLKDASLGKDFPPALEHIVQKLLNKSPDDRYQSATELSVDLEDFRDGVDVRPVTKSLAPQKQPSGKKLAITIAAVIACVVLAAWLIHSITRSVPEIVQAPVGTLVSTREPGANDIPYPKENDVKKSVASWVHDHPNATQLPFMSWGVTDAYLAPLASQSDYLSIDLHDNPIKGDGLKYLEQCRPTVLRLDATDITDDALIHLRNMTRLNAINLRNTHIDGSGLRYLKNCHLTRLDLSSTKVNDAGLKYVREVKTTVLMLDGTKVSSAGMEEIAQMKTLRALDLSHTKIDNAGLAKLSSLPELLTLYLTGDKIDDGCIKSLEHFKSLVELDVSGTGITGDGLTYLASHHRFVQIYCFGCGGDMLKALQEFQKRQPGCAFVHFKPRSGDVWRLHKQPELSGY
jgi:hypothetical protein